MTKIRAERFLQLYGKFFNQKEKEVFISSNERVFPKSLYLDTPIDFLPSGLTIKGSLIVNIKKLRSLPSKLVIEGDLVIYEYSSIVSIPKDIIIKRSLKCCGINIKKLPDNLVLHSLFIKDCKNITKLPKNLVINGDLNISRSEIIEIPKESIVKGSIFANSTKIKTIPFNNIHGNLYLSDSMIEELPENLFISGDLYLVRALNLKSLPNNMTVCGKIMLESNSKIKNLPSGLTVGKELGMLFTKIKHLNQDLIVHGKRIILNNCVYNLDYDYQGYINKYVLIDFYPSDYLNSRKLRNTLKISLEDYVITIDHSVKCKYIDIKLKKKKEIVSICRICYNKNYSQNVKYTITDNLNSILLKWLIQST